MDAETVRRLIELNRAFYEDFGASFAATRRRVQDGARRALALLPDAPGQRWLDLGCGSGSLALEWLTAGRQSGYLGLDFSTALLAEARAALNGQPGAERVSFAQADLSSPAWAAEVAGGLHGALAFAVLHHLPSVELRARLLGEMRRLLAPEGWFVLSVWQFQHSPRLAARVQPWALAGLDESDLEAGDTLLDWRQPAPAQPERAGLRYVHLFSSAELGELAARTGFRVTAEYASDGQGGRLGLYQIWQRI